MSALPSASPAPSRGRTGVRPGLLVVDVQEVVLRHRKNGMMSELLLESGVGT
ncbi:hypothetical protein [Streptomyces albofaciens]|uniref:hypothetical protein n=1 Tax=Streptomyces albofaciens TaxID=66866 RepID=UPI00142EBF3B|nr:hypothetical protein [Streptomyces albofaciens]